MSKLNTLMRFMTDIVSYIDEQFDNDDRLPSTKKPTGYLSYQNDLVDKATKHFYIVECLSVSASEETFNSIEMLDVSLQITAFALKGNFDGVLYTPQQMSINLQDAIRGYMANLKFGGANGNIRLMRELGGSPAMSYEDGKRAYTSALRYDFTIMADYE